MRYFELKDDTAWQEQQVWGEIVPPGFNPAEDNCYESKGWETLPNLCGEILKRGQSADFAHSLNELWVVSDRFARCLGAVAPNDVKCVPIKIAGKSSGFQALFLLQELDCLDWERSEIERYQRDDFDEADIVEDPELLQKIGQISYIRSVALVGSAIPAGVSIFKPKMPFSRTIVSAELKQAIESFKPIGVLFCPV